MTYRDDAERLREACVDLERELGLYRSFGETPAVAAAAETAEARAALRSFAPCFVWPALGVIGGLYLAAHASAQQHGLIGPSLPLFWGATLAIVHGMSRTYTVRHWLSRRERTLSFERDELARTLTTQQVGLTATRTELEAVIGSLRVTLERQASLLLRLRTRYVWVTRLTAFLEAGAVVSVAALGWGIHLMMLGLGLDGAPFFITGMLGAMTCLVTGGVVLLKRRDAQRDYHQLSDALALDRRRLALRTAELPFARAPRSETA